MLRLELPLLRRLGLAVLSAAALLGLPGCGYNEFQTLDEQVTAAWAEVLSQYQRRSDLIPNIVATVKGEANFVERDDAASARLDEVQAGVVAAVAHGEYSGAIAGQEVVGGEGADQRAPCPGAWADPCALIHCSSQWMS